MFPINSRVEGLAGYKTFFLFIFIWKMKILSQLLIMDVYLDFMTPIMNTKPLDIAPPWAL